jgi:hypothetical protein
MEERNSTPPVTALVAQMPVLVSDANVDLSHRFRGADVLVAHVDGDVVPVVQVHIGWLENFDVAVFVETKDEVMCGGLAGVDKRVVSAGDPNFHREAVVISHWVRSPHVPA